MAAPTIPTNESRVSTNVVVRTLRAIGYKPEHQITTTLQGCIWKAKPVECSPLSAQSSLSVGLPQSPHSPQSPFDDSPSDSIAEQKTASHVFKIASKSLHSGRMGVVDGKAFRVAEDILLESSILKYLTQQADCPASIVRWRGFFHTKSELWLAMEDGGMSFFGFIRKAHEMIENGMLPLHEWRRVVRILFVQMLECVEFAHSHNVSHNDISLENFLINDMLLSVNSDTGLVSFDDDIQLKLCDFGQATKFTSDTCSLSRTLCGKNYCQSPELVKQRRKHKVDRYDAKKNDIWCLGVCLFAMCTGSRAWQRATSDDAIFQLVVEQRNIRDLLDAWDVASYVDESCVDFLQNILQYEDKRMSLAQMKRHPWLHCSSAYK